MRRVLGYLTIWCGATVLAISLAWFGVRDVLRAEVADEPYPGVEVAAARSGRPPTPAPVPPSPAAAEPSATTSPTRTASATTPTTTTTTTPATAPARTATRPPADAPVKSTATRPTAPTAARSSPDRRSVPSRPAAKPTSRGEAPSAEPTRPAPKQESSQVKVVTVKGGQASFSLEDNECRLLSATPAAGYEAKVSGNVGWIRVDLIQGEHGSSVFCTWHGHGPTTDVWEF